jgi:hypothetical protein
MAEHSITREAPKLSLSRVRACEVQISGLIQSTCSYSPQQLICIIANPSLMLEGSLYEETCRAH